MCCARLTHDDDHLQTIFWAKICPREQLRKLSDTIPTYIDYIRIYRVNSLGLSILEMLSDIIFQSFFRVNLTQKTRW